MKVCIGEISSEGLRVEVEEDGNRLFANDPDLHFEEKIRAHLVFSRVEESVNVSGKIRTKLTLQCGRCLAPFGFTEDAAFDVEYRPASEVRQRGEVELVADEMDVLYYSGGEIDIDELLMGQVAEILPAQPLCREACRGICPQCGENRNRRECGCAPAVTDPRLAILKELLNKDQER
ncbi:MAG: DUF177 domain-containing protein [Deltaproteobacteria bacterium]|nr:DUF177 domain-containing protein [Deltaproteobacteria bacterium]